jgi:hypothetical protein
MAAHGQEEPAHNGCTDASMLLLPTVNTTELATLHQLVLPPTCTPLRHDRIT